MATEFTCFTCKSEIKGKVLNALGKSFHPEHFQCSNCYQPITSAKFHVHEEQPYCEACYDEKFSRKCKACDQPIKDKIIRALGFDWHEDHFVCSTCRAPLAGKNFIENGGKPYCESDYHELFSARCKGCNEPIIDKAIIALNEKWHHGCFKCDKCNCPVTDDQFQVVSGSPICLKCTV